MNTDARSAPRIFSLTQIRHLLRIEFSRAQRYRYPLSVLAIGVDRLATLREHHGATLAPLVLEAVVHEMDDATRPCDYLGRLPDDRMLIVLPHTGRQDAMALAGRLLERARTKPVEFQGEPVDISLSLGAATYSQENALFFDALVDAALEGVMQAFESGGDQAVDRTPGGRA